MRDRIEVAKLDGSQRRVLFDDDLVNPRAIITDSANGCVTFLLSRGFTKAIGSIETLWRLVPRMYLFYILCSGALPEEA